MMPFSRFMEMALYEPGLGYYSAGLHKLGEAGDFITAPELGPLFADCLAGQVSQIADELGDYDLFEIGAGTGQLAADLLRSLPSNHLPGRYMVLERSADLQQVQRERIFAQVPEFAGRVEWLNQPPGSDWQGVLLANEVLDAMAVERFRIGENGIERLYASIGDEHIDWSSGPAPAELHQAVTQTMKNSGITLQPGYRSEINLHLTPWLGAVTRCMKRGLALFIDYGYPRSEYYSAERSDGTLMCHYLHRAHDDPFFWPGLQDITAWVDFTALAEAADSCGLEVEGYSSQVMFLLGCGLEQVLSEHRLQDRDGGLAANFQARHLTLPGMMGEKFQVMGLGRGLTTPLRGFNLQDLRYRL